MESLASFKTWVKNFVGTYGGKCPAKLEEWFVLTQETHESLRKFFGNKISKSFYIGPPEGKDLKPKPLEPALCSGYINRIVYLCRSYIKNFDSDKFPFSSNDLKFQQTESGIRFSKAFTKYLADKEYLKTEYESMLKSDFAYYMSALGDLWKQEYKLANRKYRITLSTAAKAFILLGHLKVDEGSCFRQNSCNPHHKFALANVPNSFVGVITEDRGSPFNRKSTVFSRFWGILSPETEEMSISNMYMQNMNKGEMESLMQTVHSRLFNTEQENLTIHRENVHPRTPDAEKTIWQNGDGYIIRPKKLKDVSAIPKEVVPKKTFTQIDAASALATV